MSATIQPSNGELVRALMVFSLAYSDGMTRAKIQADVIAQKRKTVKLTIDTFF